MMRLVDRGALDLDAPVRRYLPDFAPKKSVSKTPITLRMLATHSAGLIREPPLGSYFATTTPDLASVVRSLNDTQLLARPGTVTKYSNAGVTVDWPRAGGRYGQIVHRAHAGRVVYACSYAFQQRPSDRLYSGPHLICRNDEL